MLESEFQGKLVRMLEKRGAMVLNVHGHMMQKAGYPDLHVAHWKFTGWIELKRDSGKVKTIQRVIVNDLRARGVIAFVLRYDNTDGTVQVDGLPSICMKWNEICKENVVESLIDLWARLRLHEAGASSPSQ